jgi:hypothetical protein
VDNRAPFDDQEEKIIAGMAKTEELRRWFLNHKRALEGIGQMASRLVAPVV